MKPVTLSEMVADRSWEYIRRNPSGEGVVVWDDVVVPATEIGRTSLAGRSSFV